MVAKASIYNIWTKTKGNFLLDKQVNQHPQEDNMLSTIEDMLDEFIQISTMNMQKTNERIRNTEF